MHLWRELCRVQEELNGWTDGTASALEQNLAELQAEKHRLIEVATIAADENHQIALATEAELESVTKQMSAMKEQVRSVQAEMDKLRSVHKLSREESDAICELYDVDGNGTVDMHELMQMICSSQEHRE